MSFDFPAQPQRQVQARPSGCGRLIFMLILAFAAYYLFVGRRPALQQPRGGPGDILAPAPGQPGGIGDDRQDLKREIFGDGTVDSSGRPVQDPRRQMPSTGRSGADQGWQMDEVETRSPANSNKDFRNDRRLPAPSSMNRSSNDWSISDVDAPTAEAVPAQQKPRVQKKSSNDWSLDEVETN